MRLLLAGALVAALHLPHGYHASIYATGLDHPTALSFGPDGRLYVSEDVGSVVSVVRGTARPRPFLRKLLVPLGLLWRGRTLYVSESGRVETFGAQGRRLRVVLSGLPYRLHQQDAIVAGPDGRLYLGSGSTCDACVEHNPRSAAILSFRPDGTGLRVVAKGLRNPYGLLFVGSTLYATVNGRDTLGDDEPAESLVRVRQGADFGWPACWPSFALKRLTGNMYRRHVAGRLSRAALLGGRHRIMARQSLRRRVGRVPLAQARTAGRRDSPRPRVDVRHRLRPSARAHRRPGRRPAGRRLGSRRDLCDPEDLRYYDPTSVLVRVCWCPFGSLTTVVTL